MFCELVNFWDFADGYGGSFDQILTWVSFLKLYLLQNSLTIFGQSLSQHEAAQSVVVSQNHDAFDELGDAPPVPILSPITLE